MRISKLQFFEIFLKVIYAEIGLGDNDFIETSFEEEELIYAADDDLVTADAGEGGSCNSALGIERVRSQSVQDTQEEGRFDFWLMLFSKFKLEQYQQISALKI